MARFLGFAILFTMAMAVLKLAIIALAVLFLVMLIYAFIKDPATTFGFILLSGFVTLLEKHVWIALGILALSFFLPSRRRRPRKQVPLPLLSKPPD